MHMSKRNNSLFRNVCLTQQIFFKISQSLQNQMRLLFSSSLYFFSKSNILLTGIQPTGNLHIGNYLGSVTNMLKLQQSQNFSQKYLMIADYHSLTTALTYDHNNITFNENIGKDSLQMAKVLLSSGIDKQKMCLFVQSQVPQHTELTWIFSCIGPQHWLNTMIQYKQKSHENSSVGLYTYPILMAVDILLYKANHVPVGIDQLQHIELTNKYGQRFNKQFKTSFFPKVKYVQSKFPKIMSLVDPIKKMSKSDVNERSRINLSDSQKQIREKIRRAVTDSQGNHITFEPQKRRGLSNLLELYSAFTNRQIKDIAEECQTNKYNIQKLKENLVNIIVNRLSEIQTNMQKWSDDDVRQVLKQGSQKAIKTADENMLQLKKILKIYT